MRYIWFGKISHARPVTVVADSDELIATYLAPGAACKACNPPGQREKYNDVLLARQWDLIDTVWQANRVLMLAPKDEWYSIWGSWPDGSSGVPSFWYVNLEDPTSRSPAGYDTRDLQLDVVIGPDGSCEWKDEADFAEMCRLGLITAEEAQIVREAGERVMTATRRGETWWREWEHWVPDPDWAIPALPDGWDAL